MNFYDFKDKRVLVMGLGLHGGGVGTVKFLKKHGAQITVTDLRDARALAPALHLLRSFKDIKYVLGRHKKSDIISTDLIIKNPGVRPDSPFLRIAKKYKIPVTSDVEIFFRECPAQIIGITGTRGKSTTAYLIWKFLKTKFPRVWLAGNIRKSVLEFLPRIKKGDLVVLELSSFQLEDLAKLKKSPHIAVITNILLDHLNWHKNFQEYERAKSYIFKFQGARDYLFFNPQDRRVKQSAQHAVSITMSPRLPQELRSIVDQRLGAHYRSSAGLAVAVARHFYIPLRAIKKILFSFQGLPARQEEIAIIRGVRFINDTTATMPDATLAALKRFRKLSGRNKLILIAGGQDKKLKFKKLTAEIKKSVDTLVLLPGTATKKIKRELRIGNYKSRNICEANSMHEAVKIARKLAQRGDYIILSPGAASFGLFLNEFDRGDQFAQEVKKL